MIGKIIDFVTLPFLFVTDFIDRCKCKHSWKLVYSDSDDKWVYQLYFCRNVVHKKQKHTSMAINI